MQEYTVKSLKDTSLGKGTYWYTSSPEHAVIDFLWRHGNFNPHYEKLVEVNALDKADFIVTRSNGTKEILLSLRYVPS